MNPIELFLTAAVVLAFAVLSLLAILLRRCFREMKQIREHLDVINLDPEGQLEVMARIDEIVESRVKAMVSRGDIKDENLG